MLFNLKNPIDKQKAVDRFKSLLDEKCIIELKKKMKRTKRQNRYLHLILVWHGLEVGLSLDFVKRKYFKKKVNPDLFCIEVVNKVTGKVEEDLRSSADLDSVEMTTAIDRFRNWSGQGGVYLPRANERDFLAEIEVQESKNRF